ncbi:low molecular weight protein arginine phosphatase [Bacillus badius]|nr:low molecular weight protein arginine phosphatase [Bacillus badius]KZR57600.1 hypothetical protein A3781_02105 [Bacillus badius]MED4717494.1 low molecular weight protein arginine phosphatase [Bacillus badius]
MNILFVCTGNTCRSPMAEAILKDRKQEWEVRSAGVYAAAGSGASAHTMAVLKENQISFQHVSQGLGKDVVEWADAIFTMTASHKQAVLSLFPDCANKLWTLKEFAKGERGDVADPYGGSIEEYRQTYEELDELITEALKKMQSEAGDVPERGHHGE